MQGETWRKRKDNDRLVIFCLGTVINETLEQGMLISERRKSLGRKQKILNFKKNKYRYGMQKAVFKSTPTILV